MAEDEKTEAATAATAEDEKKTMAEDEMKTGTAAEEEKNRG